MSRLRMFVLLGAVLAAILTAIGQFSTERGLFTRIGPELGAWGMELAAIAIAAAIVWFVGSRAMKDGGRPGTPAVVFGVLGVLSIPAFWLGLPSVFAAGGAALGLEAKEQGSTTQGIAAIVLAALAVGVAIWAAFSG